MTTLLSKGWHLTPTKNMDSILDVGLQPYLLRKDWLPPRAKGIWTWLNEPDGENLLGMILQRVMDHQVWQVSLLSYWFDTEECYPELIYHMGEFYGRGPKWYYHENEPARILAVPVPVSEIKVVKQFDLFDLING